MEALEVKRERLHARVDGMQAKRDNLLVEVDTLKA